MIGLLIAETPTVYLDEAWSSDSVQVLINEPPTRTLWLPLPGGRGRLVYFYGEGATSRSKLTLPRPGVVLAMHEREVVSLTLEDLQRLAIMLTIEERVGVLSGKAFRRALGS